MKNMPSLRCALFFLIGAFSTTTSQAEVRLPGFFGDSMVLQQQKELPIWGWADSGEKVTVSLGDETGTTTADDQGKWRVVLAARNASHQPVVLSVRGTNTIELKDILIGEVWLCSGQSNMEWTVRSSSNAADEIAAADYPMIRHIKIGKRPSPVPLDDIKSTWQVCSPATAGSFTACGYFMARQLVKELDVPIGLVNSSWGGTRVEPWTPPIGFQKVDALQGIHESVMARTPGTERNQKLASKHIADIQAWLAAAKVAIADDKMVSPSPAFPSQLAPFKTHQDPTMLYNGMIHALVGFPIRGAIWYQGESNHAEGMLYTEKKKALINGWRELWGQGDFSFYYVQIAPYQYGQEDAEILAQFWEAQAAVKDVVANTDMVVINDIATLGNIHPPNKQDVGKRLALLALKNDYGKDVVAQSPEMESVSIAGDSLTITFKNAGGGLKTRDGKSPTHFELIGVGSNGYQDAVAKIQGNTVVLTSDQVTKPTAFRFAWGKLAEPNLTGGTGLPVGAFRGGDEPDPMSQLSVDEGFRLVYRLDLSKLGKTVRYDVDNSDSIETFGQITYVLGLRSDAYGDQVVKVTMDAFTDDVKKIGIPTASSGADFQTNLSSMKVESTVSGIVLGNDITTGNIEFWPNNYGPDNGAKVKGASGRQFDFGDQKGPPKDGYGSMQIHNFGAKQTIFAINHWGNAQTADIGIGNSSGDNKDWTFVGNAKSYSEKTLAIYVK
ncbi:sialate O-acetylesterase [Planctomycetes bacterium K23_9]|uniref:Sialate O-acetylesterase domain-containing protein n=1 Tax=Stieleria marina TaxID=1930275 RepID=A0A517P1K9_9BACT|nr:hypothetical protein K239x_52780 [Planctomycetes bacterium K23_9]